MGCEVDNSANIFKILVATDIHLGYLEKDAERGEDTFTTFEEILEFGVAENVDFILLGGDLFHENKPSRKTVLQCMELLKKYTFGDKQINFNYVSDPSVNFPHLKHPTVNYLDPNLNISIPVFSIHGNHDDPSGLGQHSPLEMLSTTGLVNYFGRVNNLNEINVSPLLLEKGQSKLALYGLSSVKDERLHRLFRENKVRMFRPVEEMDSWFNILVLHQNHTKHSPTNYIPEEFLDSFLDLVIWGHEHECLIDPRKAWDDGFFVIQPGSSVATSLCAAEAVPKHVGVLEVDNKKMMRITPLLLKTVRPFIFEDLSLRDVDVPDRALNKQNNPYEDIVEQYVKDMIERAKTLLTGHPRQPKKPLIRLRVEYTDESQVFNVNRFGFKFTDSVANPDNIVLFRKLKKDRKDGCKGEPGFEVDQDAMDTVFNSDVAQTKVEDLVEQYFEELEDSVHQLQLLSERGLAYAVNQYVEKDYNEAINLIFQNQVNKTANYLKTKENLDLDDIEEAIESYYQERLANKVREEEEAIAALEAIAPSLRSANEEDVIDVDDLDIDVNVCQRGGRGKGTRARRARGGGRRGTSNAASSRETTATANGTTHLDSPRSSNQSVLRGATSRGRRSSRARGAASTVPASRMTTMDDYFTQSSTQRNASFRRPQRKGMVFESESDSD